MTDRDIKPEFYWWNLFGCRRTLTLAGLKANGITLEHESDWQFITPAQAWALPHGEWPFARVTWPKREPGYWGGPLVEPSSVPDVVVDQERGVLTVGMGRHESLVARALAYNLGRSREFVLPEPVAMHPRDYEAFERDWAPLPSGPKTVAYESMTAPFKNRRERRKAQALARRSRW